MSTTNVGNMSASSIPEILEDRADMGTTTECQKLAPGVVADLVESSHVDDQVSRVTEAIALERVCRTKSIGLHGGLAGALECKSDFIAVLGEGNARRIGLEALLELGSLDSPGAIGFDDAANAGSSQTAVELSALVGVLTNSERKE
jgi:hypothetical protein